MGRIADKLEEGMIALLIGLMTLLTFSQVVARYIFNSGASWAHEMVTFFFAWLIFLGMSYGVKKGAHIGVDAAVKLMRPATQRVIGMLGAAACIAYSVILFTGAWNYVSKIYSLGIEAEDIPIPRWIPLVVLPAGFALLGFRFVQVFWRIYKGEQTSLGLADEAGDALRQFEKDSAKEG